MKKKNITFKKVSIGRYSQDWIFFKKQNEKKTGDHLSLQKKKDNRDK